MVRLPGLEDHAAGALAPGPAGDLDQVILQSQCNPQLLARFKELPGFQAQPIIADVEGAGEAATSHLTGVTKNFIIEKIQSVTALLFASFKQFITHPKVSGQSMTC